MADTSLSFEAKVRRIGTGHGILIPKKRLTEIDAREGDMILVRRLEKPVRDVRGILAGTGFKFKREHKEHHLGTPGR